jgi:hypothetical protein
VAKGGGYYRGVRGSAALGTATLAAGAVPAEALAPGEMRRLPFAGELLGAVRVRASFAPIPLLAFDRAGERLEAEAQALYLQLLRLSVGEGRNWVRASKKELQGRLRLSERRLLRTLDELVAQGFVRPLHRDNRGTLWRVVLPSEVFGGADADDVLLGKAAARPAGAPPDGHALRVNGVPPRPAPRPAPRGGTRARPASAEARPPAAVRREGRVLALARALAAARGLAGEADLAAARREVQELIDEGQGHDRIAAAIAAVARRTVRDGGREA